MRTFRLALLGLLVTATFSVARPARADLNCADFPTQADAQAHLRADPSDPDGLDGPPGPNNDTVGNPGVACQGNPCPCDLSNVYAEISTTTTTATTVVVTLPPTTSTTREVARAVATTTTTARPALVAASGMAQTGRTTDVLAFVAAAMVLLGAYALYIGNDRLNIWPTLSPRWATQWKDDEGF